jgi:hypothetical protein
MEKTVGEIRQWGKWPELYNDSRMAVDGIFFDETPGLYDWKKHDYLKAVADEVRKADSGLGKKVVGELIASPYTSQFPIGSNKSVCLVHNPGTLPDPTWNYLDIANITVIFENHFASFIAAAKFNAIKNFPSLSGYPTSAFSMMLHSMGSIPDELTEWTATQMRSMAGWNYATDVSVVGEWWHSFPQTLDLWITGYGNSKRNLVGKAV